MNRRTATLDAVAGFLAARRRRRHTGPERSGGALPGVAAGLGGQAERADAQEPQADAPPGRAEEIAELF